MSAEERQELMNDPEEDQEEQSSESPLPSQSARATETPTVSQETIREFLKSNPQFEASLLANKLPPNLRQMVQEHPEALDEVMNMSGRLVEEKLQEGQKTTAEAREKEQADYLDEVYDYLQREFDKDLQSGLEAEDIKRRQWRRLELWNDQKQRHLVQQELHARETKTRQFQNFMTKNPEYRVYAEEVYEDMNKGATLQQIQAKWGDKIARIKEMYGAPQPPRTQESHQKGRGPMNLSPEQWQTFVEPVHDEEANENFEEDARANFKKALDKLPPGKLPTGDAMWKDILGNRRYDPVLHGRR